MSGIGERLKAFRDRTGITMSEIEKATVNSGEAGIAAAAAQLSKSLPSASSRDLLSNGIQPGDLKCRIMRRPLPIVHAD